MSLWWTQCILSCCSINDRLTDLDFIHLSVLASWRLERSGREGFHSAASSAVTGYGHCPQWHSSLPDELFDLDSRKAAKTQMSLWWTQCILKLHCSINDRLTDLDFIHLSVLASWRLERSGREGFHSAASSAVTGVDIACPEWRSLNGLKRVHCIHLFLTQLGVVPAW